MTGLPLAPSRTKPSLTVRIEPDGKPMRLDGRPSWMMKELIEKGPRGCTSMQYPGARLSHYCMLLRRMGFVIETVREAHSGPFPGEHGIYVLRSTVSIIDDGRAAA